MRKRLLTPGVEPGHWTYKDHMLTDTSYERISMNNSRKSESNR